MRRLIRASTFFTYEHLQKARFLLSSAHLKAIYENKYYFMENADPGKQWLPGLQLRKSEQNDFHDSFLISQPNPMM